MMAKQTGRLKRLREITAPKKKISAPKKIRVEMPASILHGLVEATRRTVGRYTARRDPPHFQGDVYHAHSDIPGGYEVSWNETGTRRHPNKFPAQVPADAKAACARLLDCDPDLLESSIIFDQEVGEEIYLLEVWQPWHCCHFEVEHPGDYATLNSYQPRDGIGAFLPSPCIQQS